MSTKTKKEVNKKTIYVRDTILAIVAIGAFAVTFLLLNYQVNPSANLKITQYGKELLFKQDIGGGDYMWGWTISIKIENRGNNNVSGAELALELKADNITIDSASDSLTLQAGLLTTKYFTIQAKESQWLDKNCQLLATIYLDSKILDQYIASW
jgi:hypothetical protein